MKYTTQLKMIPNNYIHNTQFRTRLHDLVSKEVLPLKCSIMEFKSYWGGLMEVPLNKYQVYILGRMTSLFLQITFDRSLNSISIIEVSIRE